MDDAQLPFYMVDAFTSAPYRGNPAGVVLLHRPLTDAQMQTIAAEVNVSETGFVAPLEHTDGVFATASKFGLRWFTPVTEVPLCGHGTVAAAAVLFSVCKNTSSIIKFNTKSGELTAERVGEQIALQLPLNDFTVLEGTCPALPGVASTETLLSHVLNDRAHVEQVALSRGTRKIFVRIREGADVLKSLAPNFAALMATSDGSVIKGVVVTCRGEGEVDFMSRCFIPWVGINEDPVNGSSHSALGPYWKSLLGKDALVAEMGSARGGRLGVVVQESANKVQVSGAAALVISGTIRIPN